VREVVQWTSVTNPWGSLFSSCIPDHWPGIFEIAFRLNSSHRIQPLQKANTEAFRSQNEGKLDSDTAFRFLVIFIWVLSEDRFAVFDCLPPGHHDVA